MKNIFKVSLLFLTLTNYAFSMEQPEQISAVNNVIPTSSSTIQQGVTFDFVNSSSDTKAYEIFLTEEANKALKDLSDEQKSLVFNRISNGDYKISSSEQTAAYFWNIASKIIDPLEGLSDLGITVMAACMNQEKLASHTTITTSTFVFMLCKIVFKSMHNYILKQDKSYKDIIKVLKAFELNQKKHLSTSIAEDNV